MVIKNLERGVHELNEFTLYNVNIKEKKDSMPSAGYTENPLPTSRPSKPFGYKIKELIHNSQDEDKKMLGMDNESTFFSERIESSDPFYSNAAKAVFDGFCSSIERVVPKLLDFVKPVLHTLAT